jgi:PST family polysaccharide transporter
VSELVRSVGLLSLQQAALIVLGAARTKIAAALLGPGGVGLLAQATAFQDLIRQLTMLGSANGFLKLFAEHHGRGERRRLERLVATAVALYGGLALVAVAACVVFAPPIAGWVFDDAGRWGLVVLAAAGLPFAVLLVLCGRMLSGALQFRSYVQLAVVDAIVGLLAMALLAWCWGVFGAVASFVVVNVVGALFGAALVWRSIVRPLALRLGPRGPDTATIRRLVRLAGALALASLAAAGSALFVRGEIIRQFGSDANGYYHVAWQVGQTYLGILGTSLWTYGMPKVATKLDDPVAIAGLQNDFLRIALVVLAPGIVLLLGTRELWVPVLYTRAFLAAGTMLCWQLSGELAAMLRQSMNISLLPRERLGFLVFQALFYWGGWTALSVALLPRLGAVAVALSYLAANVLTLGVTFAYHRTALGYRVREDNRSRLALAVPGFVGAVALASGDDLVTGRLAPVTLALVWLVWNRDVFLDVLRRRRAA